MHFILTKSWSPPAFPPQIGRFCYPDTSFSIKLQLLIIFNICISAIFVVSLSYRVIATSQGSLFLIHFVKKNLIFTKNDLWGMKNCLWGSKNYLKGSFFKVAGRLKNFNFAAKFIGRDTPQVSFCVNTAKSDKYHLKNFLQQVHFFKKRSTTGCKNHHINSSQRWNSHCWKTASA